ncbi:MAG: 4-alpha-glucanotransferase, partial [Chitinophagaceae bacterium]
ISAFALHPMYLNVSQIAGSKHQSIVQAYQQEKERLNALPDVDYEAVLNVKLPIVKELYQLQKQETFKKKDYQQYFNQNKHWLVPYACFCYLRDIYKTADFSTWPTCQTYKEEEIAALIDESGDVYDQVALHYFIQYHLHVQLKAATEYAHKNGVVVKGDIAIGIYRNGADAWQQPHLYNMHLQAGAPPDGFAIKGQNWGFPTYNWQQMKQDGFAWWKQRFEQMSYYFDAFRIDHILGFFRIWSIPMHAVEGIMGYFVPALPVYKNEFNEKGIWFDYNRYTKPFINDTILWEVFGYDNEYVKNNFLNYDGFNNYTLKPEFDTQRKVEQHFAQLEQSDFHHKLKYGLFDLISNVILFVAEDSNHEAFHFRFNMVNTASYRFLEATTKQQLNDLYVNYFFRRQDNFWKKEAMQKLPALKRVTNMLVCGEDLGLVPDCVPDVMKQLGLLSLEIQRMPKDNTKDFFHP